MDKSCVCGETNLLRTKDQLISSPLITGGICRSCIGKLNSDPDGYGRTFLNNFDAPVLLMQPDPRLVCTANKSACSLFAKGLPLIEMHRGGEVFDCVHAFTEAGCGKDVHCEDCRIRNAIIETFTAGRSFKGVTAVLQIKKGGDVRGYRLAISTESVGRLALVRIDCFEPAA